MLGIPAEAAEAWAGEQDAEEQGFEVQPENWPAVKLFARCATQWRTAGMGGIRTGLDYAGVRAVCEFMGEAPSAELLDDILTMEAAALGVWAEERKRR